LLFVFYQQNSVHMCKHTLTHPVTELINVAVQFHKDTPKVNDQYLAYERRILLKATQA